MPPKPVAKRNNPAEAAAADRGSAAHSAATIRDLLAYRVHLVANAISRSAATRYRRDFDVTLGEWRTLALLARFAPLGLNQLARQANVDRGQISRIVTGLTERGFVSRSDDARGKPISLVLTPAGRKLHEGLFAAALERNETFWAALTPDERSAFDRILGKLLVVARTVEQAENQGAERNPDGRFSSGETPPSRPGRAGHR